MSRGTCLKEERWRNQVSGSFGLSGPLTFIGKPQRAKPIGVLFALTTWRWRRLWHIARKAEDKVVIRAIKNKSCNVEQSKTGGDVIKGKPIKPFALKVDSDMSSIYLISGWCKRFSQTIRLLWRTGPLKAYRVHEDTLMYTKGFNEGRKKKVGFYLLSHRAVIKGEVPLWLWVGLLKPGRFLLKR